MEIEEIFKPEDNGENSSTVKRMIDKLEESSVNLENFEGWFNELKIAETTIMTQIENQISQYKLYKDKANRYYEECKEENRLSEEFIPKKLFDLQQTLYSLQREALSWYILLTKMQGVLIDKVKLLLKETKQSRIMQDTLKETKEFIKEQNNLVKDIVQSQINNVQERLMSVTEKLQHETNLINKENVMVLSKAIENFSENNKDGFKSLSEITYDNMESRKLFSEILQTQSDKDSKIVNNTKNKFKENQEEHETKKISYPMLEGNNMKPKEVEEDVDVIDDEVKKDDGEKELKF